MAEQQEWETMKLEGLRDRLVEVRNLLRQAAAVGLAQDVARLETLAEAHNPGVRRGHKKQRRYR